MKREGRNARRGRSIQQSLSTHLCEAVCANLTSPGRLPPSPPRSLFPAPVGVTPSMWVMTIAGDTRSVNPLACVRIWFKLAKTAPRDAMASSLPPSPPPPWPTLHAHKMQTHRRLHA